MAKDLFMQKKFTWKTWNKKNILKISIILLINSIDKKIYSVSQIAIKFSICLLLMSVLIGTH